MLDLFLSAGPWVMTAIFAVVALFFWLDARDWRRTAGVFSTGESRALNECNMLRGELDEQQAAIDAAQDALEKVTSKNEATPTTGTYNRGHWRYIPPGERPGSMTEGGD